MPITLLLAGSVLRVTTNYVLFSVCIVYRSCRQNDATFDVADIQRRFGIFIRGMNVAVHYFKLTGFSFDEHAPSDTFIHFTYDVYSALISLFFCFSWFFFFGSLGPFAIGIAYKRYDANMQMPCRIRRPKPNWYSRKIYGMWHRPRQIIIKK